MRMVSMNLKLPFDYRISECLNEREKLIKQIKYYSLLFYQLLWIIHCAIIYRKLGSLGSNDLPLYYFGIYQYFGGLTQFYYALAALMATYSLLYIFLFNQMHKSRDKWMKLIEVLNTDSQSLHLIGLTDKQLIDKYLKTITIVHKIVKIWQITHS